MRFSGRRLAWRIPLCLAAAGLTLAFSLLWPLPPHLTDRQPIISTRVTDRRGGLLRELRPAGRGVPVALDDVSPWVVRALVATEDRRFERHHGIDFTALARAAWSNLRAGAIESGGSTITMQVARTLRGGAGAPRGGAAHRLWRKLGEAHLALRLELHLDKPAILELWLNRVAFGNRACGIESAARLYLGKSAADLTVAEAAFLVGLPQSPSRHNPYRHPARAARRARHVIACLERAGWLDAATAAQLAALPVAVLPPGDRFRAPHLVERLAGAIDPAAPPLEIRTTIDPALQETVARLATAHLQRIARQQVHNAAVLVIENSSGAIRAYLGNNDFWDARHGGQNDGVRMLRQPGSALKPFTYALALASRRYTPATILPDIDQPLFGPGGGFTPDNYDREFHGPVPLRAALACSYNVPAARLAREFGPERLLALLHRAGFASLRRPPEHYGVGLTLGDGEVQLLELARAYAGLARGGSLPAVHAVAWSRDARGDTLRGWPRLENDAVHEATDGEQTDGQPAGGTEAPATAPAAAAPAPVIDPAIAYLLTDILSDPEARRGAFGRGGPLELPFPCAVKTGTSKDYRDNWAVGYTPRYTVALWAGNFDGAPMQRVSGVSGAGPLFRAIMTALGPGGSFAMPPGIESCTICPESGARPSRRCPGGRRELFLAGTAPAPGDTCTVHRLVTVEEPAAATVEDVAAETGAGEVAATAAPAPPARPREVVAVHPPLFHPWMREHGLPLPTAGPLRGAARLPGAASASSPDAAEQLLILYPPAGALFQIDPVLRRAFQRIALRGAAGEALADPHWWVDGHLLPGAFENATLALEPGRHSIELRAAGRTGRLVRSAPAIIRVAGLHGDASPSNHDAPGRAAWDAHGAWSP